uniref:TNase-like domain-containing protein n=1 Tax=uncultured bacterium 98 TaxID=698395 RepID=E3T6L3_9BACT|nr:hypothetical protein [uncultured bacterium 98]
MLAFGCLVAVACLQTHASEHYPVRFVIDGDTIDVGGRGRVRLLGIDAPELGAGFDTPAAFAQEARAHLGSLIAHRFVTLESDRETFDRYGRRLAYVMRDDGLFVNAEMLRAGLARVSARLPLRRLDELRRAELAAQQARRGIWGERPGIPLPRSLPRRIADEGRPRASSAPRARLLGSLMLCSADDRPFHLRASGR